MAKKVYGTPNNRPPIEVSGNTKVKTFKEQFKANCGLTLRVFKLDGTLADDNQTLADIRAGAKTTDGTCHTRPEKAKVKDVSSFYKREFGLIVGVLTADNAEIPNKNVTLKAALEGKFDEEPKSVNVSGDVDTDNIEAFEDDNGLYGFRDKATGKVVIEPKFEWVEEFDEDGFAEVELDCEFFIIDKNGKRHFNGVVITSNHKGSFLIQTRGNEGGVIKVEWGNGSSEEFEFDYDSNHFDFEYEYKDDTTRTIVITFEDINSGEIWFKDVNITSIAISKIATLESLGCYECELTSLDTGGNPALNNLRIESNKLDVAALNALFSSLNANGGKINIKYNPGTDGCDRSIAETKGWKFE